MAFYDSVLILAVITKVMTLLLKLAVFIWITADNKKPAKPYGLQVFGLYRTTPNLLMVPRVGIEPTLPKELDFESNASTSFATPAASPLL